MHRGRRRRLEHRVAVGDGADAGATRAGATDRQRQQRIRTDECHGREVIVELRDGRIRRKPDRGLLPVATGGQGDPRAGDLTTVSGDALSTSHMLARPLRAGCALAGSLLLPGSGGGSPHEGRAAGIGS